MVMTMVEELRCRWI